MKAITKNARMVDAVLTGQKNDVYQLILKQKPDVICLGYDQKFFIEGLNDFLKKEELAKTKVVKLKAYHPEKYKSSILKKYLKSKE